MGQRSVVVPGDGRGVLRPIDGAGLRIQGGLWADRLGVNRARSIPHGREQLDASGALGNFRNAARGSGRYVGGLDDAGTTFPFLDSDVYKWLEAAAWELGRGADPELAAAADVVIDAVVAAPAADGYLNTYVQLSGRARWSDLQWGHELYCIGHLVQAAVAWQRALGDGRLLKVATQAVEVIDAALGPDGERDGVDGHPEIEMALVELYRVTGAARHLDLAGHLIERRGHGLLGEGRFGAGYWQDRLPVREAPTVTGHAVRQVYLDCGAVDLAIETGDTELLAAVERRWEEMRATRTYITGGIGSHHRDEAFGSPSSCRRTGHTPRPALPSGASCSPGGCCWRPVPSAMRMPSSAPCSMPCCRACPSTGSATSTSTRSSDDPRCRPPAWQVVGRGTRVPAARPT